MAYRVSVKEHARPGLNNLEIIFSSTFKKVTRIDNDVQHVYSDINILGKTARKSQRQVSALEWRFKPTACKEGTIQVCSSSAVFRPRLTRNDND